MKKLSHRPEVSLHGSPMRDYIYVHLVAAKCIDIHCLYNHYITRPHVCQALPLGTPAASEIFGKQHCRCPGDLDDDQFSVEA